MSKFTLPATPLSYTDDISLEGLTTPAPERDDGPTTFPPLPRISLEELSVTTEELMLIDGQDPQNSTKEMVGPPIRPVSWVFTPKGNRIEGMEDAQDGNKVVISINLPNHPSTWSVVNAMLLTPFVRNNYEVHIVAPTMMSTANWLMLGSLMQYYPQKTVFHLGIGWGITTIAALSEFDEIQFSPMSSFISIFNDVDAWAAASGTKNDREDAKDLMEIYHAEIRRRAVTSGLLTDEEVTDVLENDAALLLAGEYLRSRLAASYDVQGED